MTTLLVRRLGRTASSRKDKCALANSGKALELLSQAFEHDAVRREYSLADLAAGPEGGNEFVAALLGRFSERLEKFVADVHYFHRLAMRMESAGEAAQPSGYEINRLIEDLAVTYFLIFATPPRRNEVGPFGSYLEACGATFRKRGDDLLGLADDPLGLADDPLGSARALVTRWNRIPKLPANLKELDAKLCRSISPDWRNNARVAAVLSDQPDCRSGLLSALAIAID